MAEKRKVILPFDPRKVSACDAVGHKPVQAVFVTFLDGSTKTFEGRALTEDIKLFALNFRPATQ